MRIMRMPSTADLAPESGLPYLFSSSWTRLSSEVMWPFSCSMICSEDMMCDATRDPDRGDEDGNGRRTVEWRGGELVLVRVEDGRGSVVVTGKFKAGWMDLFGWRDDRDVARSNAVRGSSKGRIRRMWS